jgi:hypothetical protein
MAFVSAKIIIVDPQQSKGNCCDVHRENNSQKNNKTISIDEVTL